MPARAASTRHLRLTLAGVMLKCLGVDLMKASFGISFRMLPAKCALGEGVSQPNQQLSEGPTKINTPLLGNQSVVCPNI